MKSPGLAKNEQGGQQVEIKLFSCKSMGNTIITELIKANLPSLVLLTLIFIIFIYLFIALIKPEKFV